MMKSFKCNNERSKQKQNQDNNTCNRKMVDYTEHTEH